VSSKVKVRGSLDEKMPVSIFYYQKTEDYSLKVKRGFRGLYKDTDQTNMRTHKSRRDSVTPRLKVFLR